MKWSAASIVLCLSVLARAGEVVITARDPAVRYTPSPTAQTWISFNAPGAYNGGQGAFLLSETDKGRIQINSSTPFIGFQFFGWQRSDGGRYEITFSGQRAARIDVYNPQSNGEAHPMNLYEVTGLPNRAYVVEIRNLNDTRVPRGFGQMNFDHAVLITQDDQSTTVPSSSSTASSTTLLSSSTRTDASTTTTTTTPTSSTTTSDPAPTSPVDTSPDTNPDGAISISAAPVAMFAAALMGLLTL